MPREPKPPAVPIEMPRTEADLDLLMKAVEEHANTGHTLGTKLNAGSLSLREVINRAAEADNKLYRVLDAIQEARADERDDQIATEG